MGRSVRRSFCLFFVCSRFNSKNMVVFCRIVKSKNATRLFGRCIHRSAFTGGTEEVYLDSISGNDAMTFLTRSYCWVGRLLHSAVVLIGTKRNSLAIKYSPLMYIYTLALTRVF